MDMDKEEKIPQFQHIFFTTPYSE